MANGSEAKYAKYSPEWLFSRYTGLDNTDLNATPPIKHGLTLEEVIRACAVLDIAWSGELINLPLELAVSIHKLKYWYGESLNLVYQHSPVCLDALMRYQQLYGSDATANLVSEQLKQLSHLLNLGEEQMATEARLNAIVKVLGRGQFAHVLYHSFFASCIQALVKASAPSAHYQAFYQDFNLNNAQIKNLSTTHGVPS